MWYDKDGKKITVEEANKLFLDFQYKVVEQTELPNGKWVSTVWLGLDHSHSEGLPVIFETMVFPKKGNYMDEDCERYSFLADAQKGHKEMVEKWSKVNN